MQRGRRTTDGQTRLVLHGIPSVITMSESRRYSCVDQHPDLNAKIAVLRCKEASFLCPVVGKTYRLILSCVVVLNVCLLSSSIPCRYNLDLEV